MDRISASVNLIIAAIGCGVLSFPFGFAQAGMGATATLIVCFAIFNVFTLDILATACMSYLSNSPYRVLTSRASSVVSGSQADGAQNLQSRAAHSPRIVSVESVVTYEELVGFHLGWRWRLLAEASIALGTSGALVGFFVVIASLSSEALSGWLGSDSFWANRTFLTFAFSLFVALPLASLDNLHSLRFSSLLSIASVMAVAALIFIRTTQCLSGHSNLYCSSSAPLPSFEWFNFEWSAVRAVPLCVFAFGCHLQGVACFFELKEEFRSRRSFGVVTTAVALACAFTYATCGIFGYMLFGSQVQGNILLSFSDDDAAATLVKFAMAIHIVLAAPVVIYPTRSMVRRLAVSLASAYRNISSSVAANPLDDEGLISSPILKPAPEAPLLQSVTAVDMVLSPSADARVDRCGGHCHCTLANVCQSAAVCLIAASLAAVAPQVQVVFGLVGATAGVSLVALIPGALLLYRPRSTSSSSSVDINSVGLHRDDVAAWMVLAVSVIVGVTGTIQAVTDL